MRYQVRHETRFSYARPVALAQCNLRLKPIIWSGQTLIDHAIVTDPPALLRPARADASLANVTRLTVANKVTAISIVSTATIDVARAVPEPMPDDPDIATIRRLAAASAAYGAAQPASYLFPSPLIGLSPAITDYCAPDLSDGAGIRAAAFALARRIMREFAYTPGATTAHTRPEEAFGVRQGVCQDFAQIMIAGLRGHGIPAAYVSGYLRTLPPPGQPRLVGADATHAWVLVWGGPALGWFGVDPTNGIWMAGDHIVVAIGRDYREVSPIDGVFLGSGAQTMSVSVHVEPLQIAGQTHN